MLPFLNTESSPDHLACLSVGVQPVLYRVFVPCPTPGVQQKQVELFGALPVSSSWRQSCAVSTKLEHESGPKVVFAALRVYTV